MLLEQERETKIRFCQNDDIESLMVQFQGWKLFDRGRAYLDWFTNFQSPENIFLLACLDDTVIGYYAAIRSWLKVGDKITKAYYGPIFVRPDCRKKRYSFLTLSHLVKKLVDEGICRQSVFYGFPNPRLGFYSNHANHTQSIKLIPRYVYFLRTAFFFGKLLKEKIAGTHIKDVTVKEIDFFDERFNDLWERASKNYPIIAVRNTEYLNWRYIKEPNGQYVIFTAEKNNVLEGYMILKPPNSKNQGEGGIVIDLFDTKDKSVTKALLLQAIEYFRNRRTRQIEFYVSDDYYEEALRSLGFLKKDGRPGVVDRLVARCGSKSIDENYLYNPKHWFINTADMLLS